MLTKSQLSRNRIIMTTGSSIRPQIVPQWPEGTIEVSASYASLSSASEKGNSLSPQNKYPYLGKLYPGKTVDFESTSEPFSQYTLADGTTVKVKMVLLDAVRLDTFDEHGNPVYQFQFQQILGVVPPDSLKKKTQ
jgi:hypothetical protein